MLRSTAGGVGVSVRSCGTTCTPEKINTYLLRPSRPKYVNNYRMDCPEICADVHGTRRVNPYEFPMAPPGGFFSEMY